MSNREEILEQQAIIIENQEKLMCEMFGLFMGIMDLLNVVHDRMNDEEKQRLHDLRITLLKMRGISDQATAARVAYGIEADD